jgi:hypothetical protein
MRRFATTATHPHQRENRSSTNLSRSSAARLLAPWPVRRVADRPGSTLASTLRRHFLVSPCAARIPKARPAAGWAIPSSARCRRPPPRDLRPWFRRASIARQSNQRLDAGRHDADDDASAWVFSIVLIETQERARAEMRIDARQPRSLNTRRQIFGDRLNAYRVLIGQKSARLGNSPGQQRRLWLGDWIFPNRRRRSPAQRSARKPADFS